MRHCFYIALSLFMAVLLSACAKQEVPSTGSGQGPLLTFSYQGTKAIARVNLYELKHYGFMTHAINSGTGAVYFDEISRWSDEDEYFIPDPMSGGGRWCYPDYLLDFYAVYPSQTITTVTATEPFTTKFTYTAGDSSDLIAAMAKNVSTTPSSVPLDFCHLLSGIIVKAYGASSSSTYKVTSMTLTYNRIGTFLFPIYSAEVSSGSWNASATGMKTISTTTSVSNNSSNMTTLQSEFSAIPGTVILTLTWQKTTGGKTQTFKNVTRKAILGAGDVTTIICKLDGDNTNMITFSEVVTPWTTSSEDVQFGYY